MTNSRPVPSGDGGLCGGRRPARKLLPRDLTVIPPARPRRLTMSRPYDRGPEFNPLDFGPCACPRPDCKLKKKAPVLTALREKAPVAPAQPEGPDAPPE
ncbi:Hypothetical protein SCLAV_3401 [Streptomyces clavuligerus]|uniref:Uncharacterized protein n=2 Tax=Streptomyces clavuligerus TaxID=1901 RepID=B5GNH2_STRCL|nr:hypothetical protein SSCG_00989 [Streptomyces clavuligerus]EFG08472.1 Hypothetical protein SCLAV_3401 [Streptomyces clavuligerus]